MSEIKQQELTKSKRNITEAELYFFLEEARKHLAAIESIKDQYVGIVDSGVAEIDIAKQEALDKLGQAGGDLLKTDLNNIKFDKFFELFAAGSGIEIVANNKKLEFSMFVESSFVVSLARMIFPIDSFHTAPIFHNQGMIWREIPEGYAVVTANDLNFGKTEGTERIDNGKTSGHTLVRSELPAFQLRIGSAANYNSDSSTCQFAANSCNTPRSYSVLSEFVGEDQPHSHNVDFQRVYLKLWQRVG